MVSRHKRILVSLIVDGFTIKYGTGSSGVKANEIYAVLHV